MSWTKKRNTWIWNARGSGKRVGEILKGEGALHLPPPPPFFLRRFSLPRIPAIHCRGSSHRDGTTDAEGHARLAPVTSAHHCPYIGGYFTVYGEHLGVCSIPLPSPIVPALLLLLSLPPPLLVPDESRACSASLFSLRFFPRFFALCVFLTVLIATTDNPLHPFRN